LDVPHGIGIHGAGLGVTQVGFDYLGPGNQFGVAAHQTAGYNSTEDAQNHYDHDQFDPGKAMIVADYQLHY